MNSNVNNKISISGEIMSVFAFIALVLVIANLIMPHEIPVVWISIAWGVLAVVGLFVLAVVIFVFALWAVSKH